MKLNIGCGHKLMPGFVNVDLPNNWSDIKPDVEADVRKLPFGDGEADEVHAYHVVEHFYRWETADVLREWARVLRPGGLMVLECPSLDKILIHFQHALKHQKQVDIRLTLFGLFGDPTYRSVEMTHKWAFGALELRHEMESVGIADIVIRDPVTHVAVRDMRLEGIKR